MKITCFEVFSDARVRIVLGDMLLIQMKIPTQKIIDRGFETTLGQPLSSTTIRVDLMKNPNRAIKKANSS